MSSENQIKNILLLIICLISLVSSHPKADQLRELTLSSDRGLIVLNAQTYKEYVMSHPRPYDIVILYTLSRKCNLCERVFNEFIQVSDSIYVKEYLMNLFKYQIHLEIQMDLNQIWSPEKELYFLLYYIIQKKQCLFLKV